MFNYFLNLDRKCSFKTLLGISIVSFIANTLATVWLNKSYAASGFPVPYYVAQLSFSAEQIQAWYAYLIKLGTLKVYFETQIIDFAFVLTTLVLHPAVLMLIGRAFPAKMTVRSLMLKAAALSTIAPIADAFENFVSFVMLSEPTAFPTFLAYFYSSFAAIKFIMFVFAYAVALLAIIYAISLFAKKIITKPTQ